MSLRVSLTRLVEYKSVAVPHIMQERPPVSSYLVRGFLQ